MGFLSKVEMQDGKMSFSCYGNRSWLGPAGAAAGVERWPGDRGGFRLATRQQQALSGRRRKGRKEERKGGRLCLQTLQPMNSADIWSDTELCVCVCVCVSPQAKKKKSSKINPMPAKERSFTGRSRKAYQLNDRGERPAI